MRRRRRVGGGPRAAGRTDDHKRRGQRRDREPEYGALSVARCALLQEGTQVRDGRLAGGWGIDERNLA